MDLRSLAYPLNVKHHKNDGVYVITFQDVNGVADGKTKEEALQNAQDLLRDVIYFHIKDDIPMPKPSKIKKGQDYVVPSSRCTLKLLLHWQMQLQELNIADLARAMSVDRKQVDRILDVYHKSDTKQLDDAADAMNVRFTHGLAASA